MRTWVSISHAATPEALQATVNEALARLHERGGSVFAVNYAALGHDAIDAGPYFSLCLTYQSDLSPDALLAAEPIPAPPEVPTTRQ